MQNYCSRLIVSCLLLVASIVQAAPEVPALSGRVVDAGNMLSAATEAQLSQELAAHETSTSNQLAVLTVPDLQGYDIAAFALEVARSWQLGQKDLNNGVLLLVARDERKIRIEVGYGLEGDLTDAQSKRIIQTHIRPAFKQGNFNQGVISGVAAITGTIDGSYTAPQGGSGGDSIMNTPLIPLGIMSIFGIGHFLQGRVHKKYINALIGGSFGGTVAGIATNKWYFGVLAALAFGAFLYNARSSSRRSINGEHTNQGRFENGRFGSGGFGSGGGGFGGGGGGFGGGGASGGW